MTREVQKVIRVLSGWTTTEDIWTPSYEAFDSMYRGRVQIFAAQLFNHATGSEYPERNLHDNSVEVCACMLLYWFADTESTCALIRDRLVGCAVVISCREHKLLAWSKALRLSRHRSLTRGAAVNVVQSAKAPASKDLKTAVNEQIELTKELLECNAQLAARVGQLELESGDRVLPHTNIHPLGINADEPTRAPT